MSKSRASDFLANMKQPEPEAPAMKAATTARRSAAKPAEEGKGAKAPTAGRAGLKHIGGYFDADTVEKVAVLRARLNLDNSELLKRAIDDLYSKQKAQRAFAD